MIPASGIAAIGFSGQQTVDHIFREIADELKTDVVRRRLRSKGDPAAGELLLDDLC